MENIQERTLAAMFIAVVAVSGLVAGIATYALFPQVHTQVQTVEKPVYVYVNQTVYVNRTVIEYRNNTVYVKVQPSYPASDWFTKNGNSTHMRTQLQNLTYDIVTDWNDTRVTKLSGYRYNFKCNGTYIFGNFTVLGPPNTLFGLGIIQCDKLGFWIWLGEDYTNSVGELTVVLRPVSISQPWMYDPLLGPVYNVWISVLVNYNF